LRERNLPPRPRAALEGVLGMLTTELERLIRTSLNELEQGLFKRAEQARSNQEQQRCFEALREVRRGRADVAPKFFLHLEGALAGLAEERHTPAFSKAKVNNRELSLVASDDLDESLALMEAASKAEIRNSQALFSLGQRFGVLAEGPAFEAEELPVGPHQLCECIRLAAETLELHSEFRVMYFRHFDRCVLGEYAQLLEQINRFLIDSRILPNLIVSVPRHRRPDSGDGHAAAAGSPDTPSVTPERASESQFQPPPMPGAAGGGYAPQHYAHPQHAHTQAFQGHAGTGHAGAGHAGHGQSTQGHGAPPQHGQMPHVQAPQTNSSAPLQPPAAPAPAPPPSGRSTLAELTSALARSRAAAAGGAQGNPATAAPAQGVPGAGFQGVEPAPQNSGAVPTARSDHEGHRRQATPWNVGSSADDLLLPGFSRPMTGWPGVAQKLPNDAANDPQGQMIFDDMRDLLAGRRKALGLAPTMSPEVAYPVRHDDIETVLAGLQNKPASPLYVGGKPVARTVGHIKQDMLNQLRQLAPEGKSPSLESEDADTFDLVGLLFDSLLKEGRTTAQMGNLMSRLQVPLLRVALRDKSFFTRRTHPARQFLNAVAETGMYWLDGSDDDRGLVDKMQVVVDRVAHEYQDSVDVFEELLSELARHMQTLVRKSDVAERRQVDALKGRERLEQAREIAQKAIQDRLAGRKTKTLIKTLLEQAWTDVLALTVLRHGEDSDAFRRRLDLVDRLIAAGSPGHEAELNNATTRVELRQEVETGLAQVGVHHEDVQAVVDRLFASGEETIAANEDGATLTEVAARLKARSKLGEEGDHPVHSHLPTRPKLDPPLDARELEILAKVKTLPFGTWFEVKSVGGDRLRRKLSWFSPLTGRCLFVNQRGSKVDETDVEHLVRDIGSGRISLLEDKSENLLDRAFGAIVRTLKSFTGQGAAT